MQKYKDFIYYNRKEIITVLLCIMGFISFNLFKKNTEVVLDDVSIAKEETQEEIQKIIIDIKGEINAPGTYEFDLNDRIIDAIEKSGGLTTNADVESINLSEKLKDEMVIYIPSKEESISEIKKDIKQEVVSNTKNYDDGKISINNASIKELMKLTGIGEKKAQSIIEYREKNGLFKDIKDLTKVSGIGNNIFEKIKDSIKL